MTWIITTIAQIICFFIIRKKVLDVYKRQVLNQSQISKIELGKTTVKEEEVLIFAKTFKVPIAKLYSMMNSFN